MMTPSRRAAMGACAAVSVLAILACAEAASGMAMAGRRATLSLQPARIRSPLRLRGGAPAGRKVLDEACHTLESHKNNKKGTISLEVAKNADKSYECTITSTIPGPVWLHWGFASRGAGWKAPPDQYLPPDTKKVSARQTITKTSFDPASYCTTVTCHLAILDAYAFLDLSHPALRSPMPMLFSLVRATRWPVGQDPISRPQNFPVIDSRCLSRLTRESPALPDLQIDDKAVQSPFKDNKIVLKVADKDAPDALAFVVKCDEPEEWFNGPGGDFWMDFKPMDPNCIGKMIIQREVQEDSLAACAAGAKNHAFLPHFILQNALLEDHR